MAGGDVDGGDVLVVRRLRHFYGEVQAVEGVDFRVKAGEIVALLGPNGAGKSTTLAVVLGLVTPTSGNATVLGHTPHEAVDEGLVGALLQSGAGSGLPAGARVGEVVRFVASLYPRSLSPSAVLERSGLGPLEGRRVDRLSGGELQRVRFALAICGDPQLLVLDEPTVGLDVATRRGFWQTVRTFTTSGRAVVFATHYLAEAEDVAKRVVVLHHGHLVADGPIEQIRRMVATKHVRFRAAPVNADALAALPAVSHVDITDGIVTLESTDADATVGGLYRSAIAFSDLEVVGAGLEQAFLALTEHERTR